MKIAVIVPCYNEAYRLNRVAFTAFCRRSQDFHFYMVDDGSKDGTGKVIEELSAKAPGQIFAYPLSPNRGKAEAVRQGMKHALEKNQYTHAAFWDADLATPLEQLLDFADKFRQMPELEVVIGARVKRLGAEIQRNMMRHYLGRVFATAASMVLRLAVYDTQCGAKMFKVTPALKKALEEKFNSKWIFDVELLARLLKERGRAIDPETWIHEFPLPVWRDVKGSKVKPSDFFKAFWELLGIWRRYRH